MSSLTYAYCILLIIRGEKVLLFHVFTFIPKKLSWLPVFTSFHSIHVQKLAKKFHGCEVIHEKCETFLSQIINIQCDPCEHNVLVLLVSRYGIISASNDNSTSFPTEHRNTVGMFCVICSHTQRVLYSIGMYLYLLFVNTVCVVMATTAERTVRDTHDRVTRVRC